MEAFKLFAMITGTILMFLWAVLIASLGALIGWFIGFYSVEAFERFRRRQ